MPSQITTARSFAPSSRLDGVTAYRAMAFPQPIDVRLDANEGSGLPDVGAPRFRV